MQISYFLPNGIFIALTTWREDAFSSSAFSYIFLRSNEKTRCLRLLKSHLLYLSPNVWRCIHLNHIKIYNGSSDFFCSAHPILHSRCSFIKWFVGAQSFAGLSYQPLRALEFVKLHNSRKIIIKDRLFVVDAVCII